MCNITTTTKPLSVDGRIRELDGLRALAILLVIAWHYVGALASNPNAFLCRLFYLGHFGVDLFFVLSGFLITSILIASREAPDYFSAFYARRALRIWPIYYSMVFLFLIGHTTGISANLFDGAIPSWTYLFLVQNFPMGSEQTYGAYWLAGTWSLCIEEQFYLIFPFVVRFTPMRQFATLLIAIILICPVLRLFDAFAGNDFRYYVNPFYRADVLCIGALIAWLRIYGRANRVCPMHILIAAVPMLLLIVYTGPTSFHAAAWQHTVTEFLFGALLLTVLLNEGSANLHFLRSHLAAFFARTSYCAYLIHHIVAYAVFAFAHVTRTNDSFAGVALTLLSFGATFLIAAASYRWIESPLLKLGHDRFVPTPSARDGNPHLNQ